ncbi:MAG: dihydrofolate reductase [bacterium]|nr:dihydrofolate reductase [bacterium]MDN5835063.1 dihydrofolate reductase [bacterium]
MKFLVVAYDKKRGIGTGDDLPWGRDLPADLEHFKQLTVAKSVIMGRKTYQSIGRPLPNRQNIVLSSGPSVSGDVLVASSLDQAYQVASSEDVAIIGGQSVFGEALGLADRIYATEVDAEFSGVTVYFPAIDQSWQEISRVHNKSDDVNLYDFDFVTYQRKTAS